MRGFLLLTKLEKHPAGAKARDHFADVYGTAKAVPFQNHGSLSWIGAPPGCGLFVGPMNS
jgi:hypothetical protein